MERLIGYTLNRREAMNVAYTTIIPRKPARVKEDGKDVISVYVVRVYDRS